ncbi:Efflux ABC transporter, ATP-binding protein [hydrothermal vent metagenome]|uniref:Efflux ABC transporter, ATP-binding protein n=1 Tax=hydrothermal vent metagenome TaxID=652676 RepID=A0A3B0VK42_9ZZZZ
MIDFKDLCKEYGSISALRGVSLHVPKGEFFAYLGPNGAGKSTTLRILTGLTKMTSGEAYLNGFHIERDSLQAKRQCGLVPQAINLDQELTVYENLNLHGLLFRIPAGERAGKINELLDYIGLADRKKSLVSRLSGGMKRRLTIARALVHSPVILFLDEPTVGLDAGIRRRIWALIKKIQNNGTTIFLTTHYIEEAEFLAERVAFLDEGKIIAVDTPEALIARQGTWAIDRVVDDDIKTVYFKTRQEATQYSAAREESFSLRRVNLEDAFLALTGKKVK